MEEENKKTPVSNQPELLAKSSPDDGQRALLEGILCCRDITKARVFLFFWITLHQLKFYRSAIAKKKQTNKQNYIRIFH